jgi:hypothetical protein
VSDGLLFLSPPSLSLRLRQNNRPYGYRGRVGRWAFHLLGFDMTLLVTLLFGAIISATDPVAVLSLFKEYGAPHRLT